MKTLKELPENYELVFEADMKKNKKLVVWLNAAGAAAFVLLAVPMLFVVPVSSLFDMEQGIGRYFLRVAVMLLGYLLYIVLHELTHGAAMKLFGCGKLNFGFNGLFAWCGCKDSYFPKSDFVAVALAPLVVWGVILGVLSALCGAFWQPWFWVVYFIQIGNITGAAGDIYVSCKLFGLPEETLVNDNGLGMKTFAPKK